MSEQDQSASRRDKAANYIKAGIGGAVGAAIIPLPVADAVAITAVQVTMLVGLSNLYERGLSRNAIKGLVVAAAGSSIGVWLWSLVKTIPGLGTIGGAVGQMAIAGTVTAAVGHGFLELCEKGENIDKDSLKTQ
jgi:GTP-binding protein Era